MKKKSAELLLATAEYSKKVKELRIYLGLSQTAFAKPLKISPTQIRRIERGESVVYEDVISQICNAYSVNRDFFEGTIDLLNACTKMNDIHPGQRLKTAREERGWTQAELAARSNVLAPVISRVEAGAKLTERQGVKLAEALEVGFDWLMNGREIEKNGLPINL